jgi:TIR domain-containing protein
VVADIFISYASADRPRAEVLKSWFEYSRWSVWIDRQIDLSADWESVLRAELGSARLVVVLWGAEARRAPWVIEEAQIALDSGRLLQIHATRLPLLAPFDRFQAVRMQSWSGEVGHSERVKLLQAVAKRLSTGLPEELHESSCDEQLTAYRPAISEALGLAFYYCARQLERARRQQERGYGSVSDFTEIREAFSAMLALLREDAEIADDREGILHRLMDDFLSQLLLLAPDRGALS